MTLTKTAILALRGLSKDEKELLAKKIGVEVSTIYRWITENHENMTKAANLKAIAEAIGLQENQILDKIEEPKGVVSKPELNGEVKV